MFLICTLLLGGILPEGPDAKSEPTPAVESFTADLHDEPGGIDELRSEELTRRQAVRGTR